ncbi:MAG: FecR family protein [Muribaculaceae bacterium]
MSDKNDGINEIIIRYLDHTATPDEENILLDWLQQSAQNSDEFSQIRDLWLLSKTVSENDEETEEALRNLRLRIASRPKKAFFSPKVLWLTKVAASIVLLLATAITAFFAGKSASEPNTVIQNKLLTADGSRGRFVLPDSTVVWLNSNTVLQYPEEFTASAREVILEGQAYFEVSKNKEKPFRVHAGKMDVEVLGTHFQVANYDHKSAVEAVLVEGSVRVAGCGLKNPVTLQPGQLLSYNKQSGSAGVSEVNTSNYTNWTHGRIRFDNSKLADIILNLEQWFATEIKCDPGLARKVSVSFTVRVGDTLDEILESMSMVAPITYSKTNGIIQISPNS